MSSSDTSNSTNSQSVKRGIKRKRDTVSATSVNSKTKVTTEKAIQEKDSHSSESSFDTSDSDDENEEVIKEVEVLSHAAQRHLKKRAKKEAKKPQSSTAPQTETSETSQKRQNSIWVGNLAFKTTDQALRAFLQRNIPDCEITRVHMPTKTGQDVAGGRGMRGENRGFAYVDFQTKEQKEKAIALSEQNLDGRKLLIKNGDDFTGRPTSTAAVGVETTTGNVVSTVGKSKTAQRILAAQKQPPAPTLFLGNLGFQATEESIRAMIEGHMKTHRTGNMDKAGEVTSQNWLKQVRMGTFEDSGLCKGFAFVDFGNTEDATKVLLDPRNHHLDGRKLVVEYASADAVRRGGGPGVKAQRDKNVAPEKGRVHRTVKATYDKSQPTDRVNQGSDEEMDPLVKRRKEVGDGKHEERRGKTKRSKPGAALALAQREKVAIVPSTGKKIIF